MVSVEPDAEFVVAHLGRQTSLETVQLMRTFSAQPEGILELFIDCLHYLPQPSQPTAKFLGPGTLTVPFGWTDDTWPVVVAVLEVEEAGLINGASQYFLDGRLREFPLEQLGHRLVVHQIDESAVAVWREVWDSQFEKSHATAA